MQSELESVSMKKQVGGLMLAVRITLVLIQNRISKKGRNVQKRVLDEREKTFF